MPEIVETNSSFEEIDTNHDGKIDKDEFRKWASNNEGTSSTTYETSTSGVYLRDTGDSRLNRNSYETSTSGVYLRDTSDSRLNRSNYETSASEIYLSGDNITRSQRNIYGTHGTITVADDRKNASVLETNSLEETNEYLERAGNIYKDPNPLIIRKAITDKSMTYRQRVLVRYLRPPAIQPPGPLVIKEVRAHQPAPLPPLIIRQHMQAAVAPPPLILRERPPTPPPVIHSETVIRHVPALPPPPRSVIIERFPSAPKKPRDIIIERWLPYGPLPERRTIVEEASAAITYPEPRNQIIIYEHVESNVVRQFEKEGVFSEDPAHYVARYGDSLLDSTTLIKVARDAGVFEDLSTPALTYSNIRENAINYERSSRDRYVEANFSFPATSMWSIRTAKYKAQLTHGQITSVTVELIEDGVTIHSRTITQEEYQRANVSSSAPKLAWDDFLQVLQVFMLGNNQERESDIARAFDILDQGKRGLYNRTTSLSDGLISPDELRAFLSTLTDEYRVDLCVFLADTDGSGQINLPEFARMVKSGLARDIICECI
ncbi:unnamed protein product [Adineta steineri]|uniref:EF-hand domain-containing protein n=2 Tax=Adineta steineri TaxID=433720 RepID=A0A819YAA3_9BILA|nr:unnamed protein product [Adineta steineri]